MLTFVSIVHVLLCVFMIFVILLQPGKDAGMGAALGGGAATSAFGGRGAVTFLSKVTAVCAIGFFITALSLSFIGLRHSVLGGEELPAAAVPAPAAASADAGTPLNVMEQSTGAPAPVAAPQAPRPGEQAAPAENAPAAPSGQPPKQP